MPSDPPSKAPQHQDDVETKTRPKTQAPKRFKVVLHNDDFTTMEFVIDILRHYFHKTESEAVHVMLTIHRKGKGAAGVYPRDVAETKVAEVTKHARESGMPLLVTCEPE